MLRAVDSVWMGVSAVAPKEQVQGLPQPPQEETSACVVIKDLAGKVRVRPMLFEIVCTYH